MSSHQQIKDLWHWFSGAPIHILGITFVAFGAKVIAGKTIVRALNRIAEADFRHGRAGSATRQKERAKTLGTILRSLSSGIIALIAVAMIVSELGFNLSPILASASVLGVALSLGAQTIVRDILAGIFMLVEDQYGVGDEVEVLEVRGEVETVGLRITTIRTGDGALWYLRNGEILKIGNRSQTRH